ncbi:MAG: hypothetical protein DRO88_12590 [Promethearchaeia archaeon]|nr:MAG: hypothetical protein DRO88_12590 [Candidatus Lokiarchaeia archaeon]
MEFCPECGNILLPKKRSQELYCKVCNKSFPLKEIKDKEKIKLYKSASQGKVKKSKVKEKLVRRTTVIVEETHKSPSISQDEREAFGELFEMSGD